MVDVKPRAHGLVQRAQAQPYTLRVEQAGIGPHQPGHVGEKSRLTRQIGVLRHQAVEVRLAVRARQLQGHGLRQRFTLRQ